MNFALYKEVLAVKPVRRLLIAGMVSRLPQTAAVLLLTLHIVLNLGQGYAAAGAAAAVMTIGMTLGAPWLGRRVDTVGLRKALLPSVASQFLIWAAVPQVAYQWILPLVFVGGLLTLPIFSVMRQSLGVLLEEEQRRTGFALDAMLNELIWMIGPAVGAVVAAAGYSVVGLTGVGISASAAGLFLIWSNPPTRSTSASATGESQRAPKAGFVVSAHARGPESAAGLRPSAAASGSGGLTGPAGVRGRVAQDLTWLSMPLAAVFAVTAAAGVAMYGADISMIAILDRADQENGIGIVLAFWCGASVIGGLVYGAMRRPVSPILLLLAMSALTIPMAFAGDTWSLALLSIPPGLLCAPVMTASSEKVTELVGESRRGEAMGWYGSALTLGGALGAPLAGTLIDTVGPWSGCVAVGAAGVVVSLIGMASQWRRSALA